MTPVPAGRTRRALTISAMALCIVVFVVSACGSDGGSDNTLPCALDTGNSAISGNITVTYSASLTGSGSVTGITYTTDAGDEVVTNPSLPWQASVVLTTKPAAIRAVGSVTTGTITIGYNAVGAPDRAEQDAATCAQTN